MVMDEFERVRGLARENPRNIVAVINHSGGNYSMQMLGLVGQFKTPCAVLR